MALTLHLPTLTLVACLVLTTAAGLMTFIGLTQRVYRGFWWWVTAQWLTALSPVCLLLHTWEPWMLPLSVLLALQWPLMMLAGLRRFHARVRFPLPGWMDALLPAAGTFAYAMVWSHNPHDVAARVAVFSLFNVGGYVYATWHVQAIPGWKRSRHLKTVLLFLLGGALLQTPRLLTAMSNWGLPLRDPNHIQQPAVLLGLVVAVMVSVYMCLLLTYERTEQELLDSHRQLREMADIDMLTQVPNRRHFNDMAARALRLACPGQTTLMRFDVDHLRQFNEQHGHAAGDEALTLVASRARGLMRERDIVGRIGGDQFVALLPDTALHDALHVARRLTQQVAQTRLQRRQPAISLSFGAVRVAAQEPLEQALSRAERALEQARQRSTPAATPAAPDDALSA
ncbi:MAG: diguanylate cyclase domain-containing protein [Aquabacterium sp.]